MSKSAAQTLNHDDAAALAEIMDVMTRETGVQLTDRQKTMVLTRLSKRVSELNLPDLGAYRDFVRENFQTEFKVLVGLLTTHHTYFFREFSHFEALTAKVLPEVVAEAKKRGDNTLRVWSAAASRGQEVYSLAMWIQDYLKRNAADIRLEVLGTDIDEGSIAYARNGVYPWDEVKEIPLHFLSHFWTRGKDELANFARAKQGLRDAVRFDVFNLVNAQMPGSQKFDLIWCRNVFIYFTPAQVVDISRRLLGRLESHGYFFVGLSESLRSADLPMETVGPSMYRHKGTGVKTKAPRSATAKAPGAKAKPRSKIRVLCVDDSKTIHTVLKAVLTEAEGFEIVGTALSGKEAAEWMAAHPDGADALTLDIHMPEMTGVEYLTRHFGPKHPPVVMVSSVNREDATLALKSLELGASDYVEKPAMAQLADRADEIRVKIRMAVADRASRDVHRLDVDREFDVKTLTLRNPSQAVRALLFHLSGRKTVKQLLSSKTAHAPDGQPPWLLMLDSHKDLVGAVVKKLEADLGRTLTVLEAPARLESGKVYVTSVAIGLEVLAGPMAASRRGLMVCGDVSEATAKTVRSVTGLATFVQEGTNAAGRLLGHVKDEGPVTSLVYLVDAELCKGA